MPEQRLIRQIQDCIFNSRNSSHKIPNWFYRFFRSDGEKTMDQVVKEISEQLN